MKMSMFHRGLILVGTPLLAGMLLSGSLYFLMQHSESQRLDENRLRRLTSLTARELVLSTEVVAITIFSAMQNEESLRKLYADDRAKMDKFSAEIEDIYRKNPDLAPAEQTKFFTSYNLRFRGFVDDKMPKADDPTGRSSGWRRGWEANHGGDYGAGIEGGKFGFQRLGRSYAEREGGSGTEGGAWRQRHRDENNAEQTDGTGIEHGGGHRWHRAESSTEQNDATGTEGAGSRRRQMDGSSAEPNIDASNEGGEHHRGGWGGRRDGGHRGRRGDWKWSSGFRAAQQDPGDQQSEMAEQVKLTSELEKYKRWGNDLTRKAQAKLEQSNRLQLIILGLALVLNPITCIALAIFYRNGILKRIQVIAKNTNALTSGMPLLPADHGSDEIFLLDQSFHQMHRQLEAASENERNLFDNASDVICVIDKDNKFLRINPACQKHWSYAPSELQDHDLLQLVPADSHAKVLDALQSAKSTPTAITFESPLMAKDGEQRAVVWSIYWSAAEEKLFCILHDVTENKKIELMRRDFLSMISADLKQPLKAISDAISRILSETAALPAAAINKFKTASGSMKRLVALVDDLLQVAELEFGKLEIKCTNVDMVDLLKRSIADVESLAKDKQIKLELSVTQDEMAAFADPDRTIQVVVNLLSNAIKFSPEGATISLALEQSAEKVVCKVIDTGRGIPQSKLEVIFEKFGQVDVEDGKRKAGTGLGLPICKQIVESQSGEIGVESSEGKGSTFWFSLPKDQAAGNNINAIGSPTRAMHGIAPTEYSSAHTDSGSAGIMLRPKRFPLYLSGILLIGVPSLLGLIVAGSLTWSLVELTNERAQELHQREISMKAFDLMNNITFMANGMPGIPGFPIDRDQALMMHENEFEKTLNELTALLKGDKESLKYADKVKSSFANVRNSMVMRHTFSGFNPNGGGQFNYIRDLMHYVSSLIAQTRNLYRIIERAEAKEFRSPEIEMQIRQREAQLLVAGLVANILLSVGLSMQLSLGISRRLAIMANNAGRLAREEDLNPLLGGNDELTDLDESFHKAAASLVESRRKERAVFDNSKDVLCTVSNTGRFISTNPAAELFWGYDKDELMEKSVLDLVHPDDALFFKNALLYDSNNDADIQHECRMLRKDGRIIHCSWSASLRQAQAALFCVVHDVTDKKELDILRSEFLAIVSHDLRTPLNSVSLSAHLGQEGVYGVLPENANKAIDEIVYNCQSLLDLITDILDMEKLDAAKMELNLEQYNLAQLIESVEKVIPEFVDLQLDVPDSLQGQTFKIDRERFPQALSHLAKFLRLQAKNPSDFRADLQVNETGIAFNLTNAGPPLDEHVRQHMFERYKDFSLDSVLTEPNGFHADLRLPLAALIIRAHGGSVEFENSDNTNGCLIRLRPAA